MEKQRIIAISNQKGGVGKTTTTVNLGGALARMGYQVLVVDMDPQSHLTTSLGIDEDDVDLCIAQVFEENCTIKETIFEVQENLDLVPATIELANTGFLMANAQAREHRLRMALEELPEYNFIIIDAGPGLDTLTINTLTAAQEVIIPLQAEFLSAKGVGRMFSAISDTRKYSNPDLEITGVLITMHDNRIKLHKNIEIAAKEQLKTTVFKTRIPRNIRLAEAPQMGKTIFQHDDKCAGAQAYLKFAQEVISIKQE